MKMSRTSSVRRIWVKASPRGTRSGFAVLPDEAGGHVTVTVLPKPWALAGRAVREYEHVPGSTTHVVMHETELAAINTTSRSAGALAMGLATVSTEQTDLLALSAPPDGPMVIPASGGAPFRALINLMLLAERGTLTSSSLTFEGAFAPSLLRLLTQERLLEAVEGLIFRARPRYAERTETLDVPRGRLGESSLRYSLATGVPWVESTFDELTIDTPLLQVVASALRVIVSDRLPLKVSSLRPRIHVRAVQLLRHLSGVSLIERQQALAMANSLWLSPLDQVWAPAVQAAIPVLRDWAVDPELGDNETNASIVQISTEKFWEQCTELVLDTAFGAVAVSRGARAGEGVSVPTPWRQTALNRLDPNRTASTSFPDFMFNIGRRVIVADAKYKLGGESAPASSDAYQMFAYSHLATLDHQLSDLAVLLYPSPVGELVTHNVELERLRDRRYSLWSVRLPFPMPSDLQTQRHWGVYIAHQATTMRELSTDWIARSPGKSSTIGGEPPPNLEAEGTTSSRPRSHDG